MRKRLTRRVGDDRGDGPYQPNMGVTEQEVSARDDRYGSRSAGVFTPAGEGGWGHHGVGAAAEDVDRARQRWFATVAVAGTDPQVVADERH